MLLDLTIVSAFFVIVGHGCHLGWLTSVACVVVTGCLPFPTPSLLSDGCSAYYRLGYWHYSIQPFAYIVQMVASGAAIGFNLAIGIGTCTTVCTCVPHLKFAIKEMYAASRGSLFSWLWVWDTLCTTTLPIGTIECLVHVNKGISLVALSIHPLS